MVEARPICTQTDKRNKIFGRVYAENCRPLVGAHVMITCDTYSECCTTNGKGIFETYLPFSCKCCEMKICKEGYYTKYVPTHLVKNRDYTIILKRC